MPQFLVIAHDDTDADAPARRQAARPAYLASIAPLVESGRLIIGGAILDAEGGMIGSVLIADFPDRAALRVAVTAPPVTPKKEAAPEGGLSKKPSE
jgi:uncharacterized protein YciI